MNAKLTLSLLAAVTLAALTWLPTPASPTRAAPPVAAITEPTPFIDAVFVLDTTGSMSGLIQTAKEKIWSIASTMASAQPTPLIRIGLVAFRDRGDSYVVKTVDLSQDLDSVYAELMQFSAGGGGDGPESVNAALDAAVNQMSWSEAKQAYRVIFLVGDSPPHMDYQDESRYPEILAAARQRDIVVNAIQCGTQAATVAPWTRIAELGAGRYFQVEQAGGAVSMNTPFDADIAALSARLDGTRLFYGSRDEREVLEEKAAVADSISAAAPSAAKAQRGLYNISATGRRNLLGEQELVAAVSSGEIELDDIAVDELPEALRDMDTSERARHVADLTRERELVEAEMRLLAERRQRWVKEAIQEQGGASDSLEQKLYDTIATQAGEAGFDYESGPSY